MDARNFVSITGGLTADPELINDKILKMRMGVDYSGREDQKSTSGYFDVTYFLGDDRNSTFVRSQLGNFKKGTPLGVVGRLVQERFQTKDGSNASRVIIYAEGINYAGPKAKDDEGAEQTALPSQF